MPSLKLSVVIPSYNSAVWLAHAIESCQKQTYANIEVVVVDDGSTDSTHHLMASIKDKRVRYIRLKENMGRSYARNFGNKMASGSHILVLDSDDLAYPDRARLTAKKLEKADFVYGSCDSINIMGHKLGSNTADVFDIKRAMREKLNLIVHSSCAYTKELALKFPYQEGEYSDLGLDDWRFQLDVLMSGVKHDFIPQPIGAYREMETGISKTRDKKKVAAVKDKFLESLKVAA